MQSEVQNLLKVSLKYWAEYLAPQQSSAPDPVDPQLCGITRLAHPALTHLQSNAKLHGPVLLYTAEYFDASEGGYGPGDVGQGGLQVNQWPGNYQWDLVAGADHVNLGEGMCEGWEVGRTLNYMNLSVTLHCIGKGDAPNTRAKTNNKYATRYTSLEQTWNNMHYRTELNHLKRTKNT